MKRPPFNYPTALPLVPVFTPKNAELFMGDGMLVRDSVLLAKSQFETAPLKMEKTIDLLGISMCDALVARGDQDHTDELLPKLYLREIYVRFSESQPPIRFADMHLMDSTFEARPEAPYAERAALLTVAHTTRCCGYELSWQIRVLAEASLEFATVRASSVCRLDGVRPLDGAPELTAQERKDFEQKYMPEVLGYTLSAYRGNRNVRPR